MQVKELYLEELDVVITSAKYGQGKRSDVFGSFGISVNDGHGQFTEIGSVGSGFSVAVLAMKHSINEVFESANRLHGRVATFCAPMVEEEDH